MKKIILLIVITFLNGCCYNQYERKGYSVGLDCLIPAGNTGNVGKVCKLTKPDGTCDDKVEIVKKSIQAQSKN